ncbi:MAG: carboxypeptidase regulatory-like domain-containing protein [Planctomycetes bacterium]|nr:carboxypeptidase regulatory-like domain-containing protein [Planctomycetota bacterium]
MSSAVKAALISAVLIVAIIAGYFVFVGPDAPPGRTGPAEEPIVVGRVGVEPEPSARPLIGQSSAGEDVQIILRVRVQEKESQRKLLLSRLRILRIPDGDTRSQLVEELPREGAQRGGDFETQLGPGVYHLEASCKGYAGVKRSVTLVKGQEPDVVVLELERGNSISGRILARGGAPIAGAEVYAFQDLGSPDADLEETLKSLIELEDQVREMQARSRRGPDAVSGSDGYYQIDGLSPVWYTVRATAGGYSPEEKKWVPAPSENVDLTLAQGGAFEGSVVEAGSRRPIAGAEVSAYVELEDGGLFDVILAKARPPVGKAVSVAEGAFRFTQLGAGLYNFVVRAPGYQEFTEMKFRIYPGENPPKVFELTPGSVIRGIVRGPDDEPVVGAKVKATQIGGGGSPRDQVYITFDDDSVQTDEAGAFLFNTLKGDKYMLIVFHQDYQSVQRKDVQPTGDEIVIKLDRGGELEGIVLDAKTGQGIPGAAVAISDVANLSKETVTDENGEYYLSGLNLDSRHLMVRVKAPGYARDRRKPQISSGRRAREDFELKRTATVEGRVLLSDGSPLADCRVEVRQTDAGSQRVVGHATSDEEGNYLVTDVEPGTEMRVRIRRKAFLDSFSESFSAEPGERIRVNDLVLQLGGEVQGTVTDMEGRPISGCMVTARRPQNTDISPGDDPTVQTDASGVYLIRGLEAGSIHLLFKATGYVDHVLEGIQVIEGQRNYKAENNVKLDQAGIIEGRIVSRDGSPVTGAEVLVQDFADGLRQHRTISDPAGRFRIGTIESKETVNMEVRHDEYREIAVEGVKVGTRDLHVILDPLGRLRGSVVDSDGNPVMSFTVHPQLQEGASPTNRPRPKTFNTTDGRFDYGGLADAAYDVHVRSPQYSAASVKGIRVEAGDVVDLGRIVLELGGIIEGRVVEKSTGRAIAGASVRIVQGINMFADRASADAKPLQMTREDGSFRFTGLKDGSLTVEVKHADYMPETLSSVNTQIAETCRGIVVELGVGGEIYGAVTDETGAAQKGMTVYLMNRGGERFNRTATADDRGAFVFRGVPPGRYLVKAHRFGRMAAGGGQQPLTGELEVDLEAGTSVEVSLLVTRN